MKKEVSDLLAKIAAIAYIIFISLFAFDEILFSPGFLIHLIPTLIFTAILITAWFKPKVGGVLFALAGIGTIIVFNTYKELITLATISAIPIAIGALFWFSKKH
jgi:hypothetical protein